MTGWLCGWGISKWHKVGFGLTGRQLQVWGLGVCAHVLRHTMEAWRTRSEGGGAISQAAQSSSGDSEGLRTALHPSVRVPVTLTIAPPIAPCAYRPCAYRHCRASSLRQTPPRRTSPASRLAPRPRPRPRSPPSRPPPWTTMKTYSETPAPTTNPPPRGRRPRMRRLHRAPGAAGGRFGLEGVACWWHGGS